MPSVRWDKTSPNDVACPVPQCGRTFGSGKNTQHLLELHVARVVNEHKREFYEKSRQGGSYYDAHLEVYNKLSGGKFPLSAELETCAVANSTCISLGGCYSRPR
jgi:hypothetical protein